MFDFRSRTKARDRQTFPFCSRLSVLSVLVFVPGVEQGKHLPLSNTKEAGMEIVGFLVDVLLWFAPDLTLSQWVRSSSFGSPANFPFCLRLSVIATSGCAVRCSSASVALTRSINIRCDYFEIIGFRLYEPVGSDGLQVNGIQEVLASILLGKRVAE